MGKEILNQVQEAQSLIQDKPKEKHIKILIKLTETKHKETILSTSREKQQATYKGKPIQLIDDLSAEILQARREWHDTFKVLKKKKV